MGHAPWGQWNVYRQIHMLIMCTRQDAESYDFTKKIVNILGEYLPEAKARPARAKDFDRLHGLFSSEQISLVILSRQIAKKYVLGVDYFKKYGKQKAKLVYDFNDMVLLSTIDFPDNHAERITDALIRASEQNKINRFINISNDFPVAIHEGSKKVLDKYNGH